jgi:hypothetical protein
MFFAMRRYITDSQVTLSGIPLIFALFPCAGTIAGVAR